MKARILVLKSVRMLVRIALAGSGLILVVGAAHATDISGTISSTLVITEDSQLVGDVTCTVVRAPCIQFGADDITLRLNGFTMTGQAHPTTGCGPTSASSVPLENGISTDGHSDLEILGPGLVQNFRRSGVLLLRGSTRVKVKHVTASTNCVSGIILNINVTDSDIEENVTVRNGHLEAGCGGIEVGAGSNNNRIRRNETSGNGYAGPPNNDFGIGLDDSHGNLVEENSAVGNTNGILVSATATGNVVRRNLVTGNPPLQVSLSFGAFVGAEPPFVDIQNLSPAGANTFEDNLCVTSLNAPCPNFPAGVGHKNGDEGER